MDRKAVKKTEENQGQHCRQYQNKGLGLLCFHQMLCAPKDAPTCQAPLPLACLPTSYLCTSFHAGLPILLQALLRL